MFNKLFEYALLTLTACCGLAVGAVGCGILISAFKLLWPLYTLTYTQESLIVSTAALVGCYLLYRALIFPLVGLAGAYQGAKYSNSAVGQKAALDEKMQTASATAYMESFSDLSSAEKQRPRVTPIATPPASAYGAKGFPDNERLSKHSNA